MSIFFICIWGCSALPAPMYKAPRQCTLRHLFSSLKTFFWRMCVFSIVLDYIMNSLTSPRDSIQDTAEQLGQDLLSWNTGLTELGKALNRAEIAIKKTILMNVGNQEVVSDPMVCIFVLHNLLNNDSHMQSFSKLQFTVLCPQNHLIMYDNKQDGILFDLAMITVILRDTDDLQNILNTLKNVRVEHCNVI